VETAVILEGCLAKAESDLAVGSDRHSFVHQRIVLVERIAGELLPGERGMRHVVVEWSQRVLVGDLPGAQTEARFEDLYDPIRQTADLGGESELAESRVYGDEDWEIYLALEWRTVRAA
jgi:hypothetical protein